MPRTAAPATAAGTVKPQNLHSEVIAAAQAKAHFLQIIESVRVNGHSVLVTRRGKPTVQIVPVPATPDAPLFGRLKGVMQFPKDIVSPDTETWESET